MSNEENKNILEPVKFGVDKFKSTNKSATDQFGQQYDADADQSKWSNTTPADSRKAHSRADTDLGPRSIHHTLGTKHNQASPGDHDHSGVNSNKLGPLEMVTGGVKRPAWTLPNGYNTKDLKELIEKFTSFRSLGGPGDQQDTVLVSFTALGLYTLPIIFPNPYDSGVVPVVMTNIASSGGNTGRWDSRAYSITNTGFTLFLFKGVTTDADQTWTNIPVQWRASR